MFRARSEFRDAVPPASASAPDDDEDEAEVFSFWWLGLFSCFSCLSYFFFRSRIVLPALRAFLASILSETDGCLKALQAS